MDEFFDSATSVQSYFNAKNDNRCRKSKENPDVEALCALVRKLVVQDRAMTPNEVFEAVESTLLDASIDQAPSQIVYGTTAAGYEFTVGFKRFLCQRGASFPEVVTFNRLEAVDNLRAFGAACAAKHPRIERMLRLYARYDLGRTAELMQQAEALAWQVDDLAGALSHIRQSPEVLFGTEAFSGASDEVSCSARVRETMARRKYTRASLAAAVERLLAGQRAAQHAAVTCVLKQPGMEAVAANAVKLHAVQQAARPVPPTASPGAPMDFATAVESESETSAAVWDHQPYLAPRLVRLLLERPDLFPDDDPRSLEPRDVDVNVAMGLLFATPLRHRLRVGSAPRFAPMRILCSQEGDERLMLLCDCTE